jgi:hypothetical protein
MAQLPVDLGWRDDLVAEPAQRRRRFIEGREVELVVAPHGAGEVQLHRPLIFFRVPSRKQMLPRL